MGQRHGQHFLRDEGVVRQIVEAARLKPSDTVFEVGPGEGILTKEFARLVKTVIACEIDFHLQEELHQKFQDNSNVHIELGDILQVNIPGLIKTYAHNPKEYVVVSNLPYYIASNVLRIFLESSLPPTRMVVMVQKEVALRMVSAPGSMSMLSVAVQYYGNPTMLFDVPPDAFLPVPQVESTVVEIDVRIPDISSDFTRDMFRLAKIGFSARRKTLENNLSVGLGRTKEDIRAILVAMGFEETIRAQELSVDDWMRLAERFRS